MAGKLELTELRLPALDGAGRLVLAEGRSGYLLFWASVTMSAPTVLQLTAACATLACRGETLMSTTILLGIPEVSAATKSRAVAELAPILNQINGVAADVARERSDTQDAGTLLSLALSAPAVMLTVKAIAAWMVRSNQGSVEFLTPDGTKITIRNADSDSVARAIEALSGKVNPGG